VKSLLFDLGDEGATLVNVLSIRRAREHRRGKEQVRLGKEVTRDIEHASLISIVEVIEQDEHVNVRCLVPRAPCMGAE